MSKVVKKEETAIADRTPVVIAAEIRQIESQTREIVIRSAIEIGQRLHEAKALLPHGGWGKWLQDNVSYSQSTANNFMRVAEEYGTANLQTLGNLSYTQAVALLAVPAEEREQFAEENNVEEMSSRELQKAIKEKQELERQLEEQKKKFDDWARKQAAELEEEKQKREALYEKYEEEVELRKAQAQTVSDLQHQLEAAQSAGDDKAAAKIKAELRKAEKAASESNQRAADLEEKLKQAEAEIAAKVEEQVNAKQAELEAQAKAREEEAAKQVAQMEEQLRKNNNVAAIKVKVQYETAVNNMQSLLAAVEELENAEQKTAIKGRIAQLCDEIKTSVQVGQDAASGS